MTFLPRPPKVTLLKELDEDTLSKRPARSISDPI